MIKISFFRGQTENGPSVIPLFGPADPVFEKTAAPSLLPEVARYIASLRPRNDAQYSLVNALGAGEYWGSNVNGDHFPEAALVHSPDDWTGVPAYDRAKAKEWAYGFPTFYQAKPFLHHRNKDFPPHNHPFYGEVELAAWNPVMKRVELVTRVDKKLCELGNGLAIWDKLKAGDFPDVSMGAKVPFDTCSICLDWKLYRQAQSTFDPKKHKHPGEAVLEIHRSTQKRQKNEKGEWEWVGQGKIRGLSITRKDYCDHAKDHMNLILPDGRKVFVFNDYPRFFDISFVFIGADKTAKVMMKIAGAGSKSYWFLPGAELAEKLGYVEEVVEKTASVDDEILKLAFGKVAKFKEGEILKRIVPSQFAAKAVPLLTKTEADLPKPVLERLGVDAQRGLSTTAGMGIILRPREFQRVILIQLGQGHVADDLESRGVVFPRSNEEEALSLSAESFSHVLAHFLAPFMGARSCLGPCIEARVAVAGMPSSQMKKEASSLSSELLRKIGSAYNGYRRSVMNLVSNAPSLMASTTSQNGELLKVAQAPLTEMFTPLSAAYLKTAYYDELGYGAEGDQRLRGEGMPLKEHAAGRNTSGGFIS